MAPKHPGRLDAERFAVVVRDSPLVSFDLIVRTPDDRVLLGYRVNEPARGSWFVPGGRICKDETLSAAFERITAEELGFSFPLERAQWLGVYEHIYSTNFANRPGFGTHHIVLAHELRLDHRPESMPEQQHSRYRWFLVEELLRDPEVHENTKAYFRPKRGRTSERLFPA